MGEAVRVVSFGCRLNVYESEAIKRQAEAAGHRDLIVINTCAVTAEATRQARQSIRRLGRENPGARIVVTGCAAQIEPGRFASLPEVALVLGNHEKMQPRSWQALAASNSFSAGFGLSEFAKVQVADIMTVRDTALHMLDAFEHHTRAFVQVQNGCDHRCTFCIIPFGRGNSRSVPMGAVVEQVRQLVAHGAKEVVLTGVDMTGYGKDLPGAPTLGLLVQAILRHVPDLPRLRLSSIDAVEVDDALRDAIAGDARLMPHLHLSLQSGDDLILKRMKRRHTRADAIRFSSEMQQARPDMVFGADLIAGFPTEDEAAFQRSADLIAECGLTHLHVFPFSPREGTPAARMPQLPAQVIVERARRLRLAGDAAYRAHLTKQVGRTLCVLTERGDVGRTEGFAPVRFAGKVQPGLLLPVAITGEDGARLLAA
ncbi:MAG: tRNA (N(6)-L-threonylcarbamoyladenosine(37)-C(2))-methylthiotransferase MtaB [Hyphomicrobiales bacterium]|nr:tRNA (N(6)-L-threonylcarbamoyladenosine(37)-C(2))-methylthiotransferase MtaB [Hyphomicrobiales bacterium]